METRFEEMCFEETRFEEMCFEETRFELMRFEQSRLLEKQSKGRIGDFAPLSTLFFSYSTLRP